MPTFVDPAEVRPAWLSDLEQTQGLLQVGEWLLVEPCEGEDVVELRRELRRHLTSRELRVRTRRGRLLVVPTEAWRPPEREQGAESGQFRSKAPACDRCGGRLSVPDSEGDRSCYQCGRIAYGRPVPDYIAEEVMAGLVDAREEGPRVGGGYRRRREPSHGGRRL